MKVKFMEDRGVYKKDQVVEVPEILGLQLINTGAEGSATEVDKAAKVTPRSEIQKQIKAAASAKAKELKAKLKEIEE